MPVSCRSWLQQSPLAAATSLSPAAQVDEQSRRYRAVFVTPPDAISRLHATLQISSLEFTTPPPPELGAAVSANLEWQEAVLRAGLQTAVASTTRVHALAVTSAAAAASASVSSGVAAGTAGAVAGASDMPIEEGALAEPQQEADATGLVSESTLSGAKRPRTISK